MPDANTVKYENLGRTSELSDKMYWLTECLVERPSRSQTEASQCRWSRGSKAGDCWDNSPRKDNHAVHGGHCRICILSSLIQAFFFANPHLQLPPTFFTSVFGMNIREIGSLDSTTVAAVTGEYPTSQSVLELQLRLLQFPYQSFLLLSFCFWHSVIPNWVSSDGTRIQTMRP